MSEQSSPFGFSAEGLYRLSTEQLLDLAGYVREDDKHTPPDKDVIIRGVLLTFLREASDAERDATHDQIMRAALVSTAKAMGAGFEKWDSVTDSELIATIKTRLQLNAAERFHGLSPEEQQQILDIAAEAVRSDATKVGVGLIPTVALIAGQSSGFGIYLATTTGISAVSSAIGVTLPFAVYQGATTALGVMLGPIGWIVAGTAVSVQLARVFSSRRAREQQQKLVTLVIAMIYAIGQDPYAFFGVPATATLKEVESTYRAIVKTIHPDLVHDDVPEWMRHQLNAWLLAAAEHRQQIRDYFEDTDNGGESRD